MAARRRRQLAVTRTAQEEDGATAGCDGVLPLFIETADPAAARAAIAALEAVLRGATPLMNGASPLNAELLCAMEYKTSYVYDTGARVYSVDDVPAIPEAAAAAAAADGGSTGARDGEAGKATLWGAVGGGVGAAVVVAALVLLGVSARRLLARSSGAWDVAPEES